VTPGDRYGYLVVLDVLTASEAERRGAGAWARVRCDCGLRTTVRARHLRVGLIRSCGCKKWDLFRASRRRFA
jgi:hypothetical protein